MGIEVNQWRATIGLWHAFMIGRPLIRRRRPKPSSGVRKGKLHQTRPQNHLIPFVSLLTLLIMLGSRSNDLNNLPCRLTAAYISPPVRLATILLLVTSEKFESIDKRRSTGVEQPSLISPNFLVPILTTLLILAGDVELNPGPFKPVPSTNFAFICSLSLVIAIGAMCSNAVGLKLKNDDLPSLPVLRQFAVKGEFKDILTEIQNDHKRFGTLLLKDDSGNVIKGIEKACRNGPQVDITVEILRQWLQGRGRLPVTWQTLVDCLRDAKLNVVADYIEGALSQECDVLVSTGTFTGPGQQQQPTSPVEAIIPMLVAVIFGGILMAVIMIVIRNPRASAESKTVVFARENRGIINSKFAEFQAKVCDKLLNNGVNIRRFRLFAKSQFRPGHCIPPPPANLTDIFEAITSNGLWDCLHYSPLVHIVKTFGTNDPEMQDWVQTYEKDLKAYSLVTTVEDYIETDLSVADFSPASRAKYDRRYYCPVEWKTNFVDHSLNHLTEVWKLFSCRYLVPDSPPTAILDRIRKGCFVVTWVIPSHLIPPLIKRIKNDTEFFQQHCILRVTVGEECVYEEVAEKSTLEEAGVVAMPESGVQVGENQKRELYEEEMELAKETGVGVVAKLMSVVPVAHSTKKQKPTLYQEETGHAKIVTTMNSKFFWITTTILVAVLIYFMVSGYFGFNILNTMCEQVLYWLREGRYMEKYLQVVTTMDFFWIMITGTILIALLMYFRMSVVFGFNLREAEYMEEVLLERNTNIFHEGLRPGLDDLNIVSQALITADTKWHNIGNQLGLSTEELCHIGANYTLQQECLCETLRLWLRRDDHVRTWKRLIDALKNATVKEYHLAKIVEEKYCDARVNYSDYLRRFYRNLAPQRMFQWPELPHYEFVTLAMIKRERITFSKKTDKFVQSTLHGNIDDILRQKEEIDLQHIFDKVEDNRKVVLIEGAPGAGKTMLVWHICREWGRKKLFTQFSIIILATLRDFADQEVKSLTDVLSITCENPEDEDAQKISSKMEACHGRGVLFLLDGWDELSKEQQKNEKLFFRTLIEKPEMLSLHKAAIIVTSRPVSSGDLRKFVSLRVEIVGFTSSNIKKYFETCLKSEEEHSNKIDKLLDIVADNPLIESICYLPLNAAIVVYLFCACDYTLPTTYHEIFKLLVHHCIIRYAEKSGVNLEHQRHTFEKLPKKIRKPFKQICKLAYLATEKNVITFSSDTLLKFEVTEPLNHLGLMQSVKTLLKLGKGTTYHFLHLSLQELLAAYHICKMTPEVRQVKVFKKLFDNPRFSAVFGFYAGFTKFKKEGIRDVVAEIVQKEKEKISEEKTLLVSLMNWLYEAQDIELCHFVKGVLTRDQSGKELDLSYTSLKPSDTLSVGYFLSTVCTTERKCFYANLSRCSIEDHYIKFLVKGLSYHQPMNKARVEMNLSMNCIHNEGLEYIADFLKRSTSIKALNLGRNRLSHSNVQQLMKALTVNSSLTKLDISESHLDLTGEVGVSLQTMLKKNKSLCSLDISYSIISCDCIADGLVQNKGLKILHMKYCNITAGGMRQISEAIQQSKLEELSIGPLEDDCIEPLTNALSSLRSLTLRGTLVTDQGLETLGGALQENNSLLQLSLWDFKTVTSEGLKKLGEQLKRNQMLEVLALRLIGPSPIDGLKHLVTCLQDNTTLSSLKLLEKHKPQLEETVCSINKMRQLPLKLETYSE